MNNKEYIEHEVRIRVQEKLSETRFEMLEKSIYDLRNSVINYILGIYGIIGAASLSILINFLWRK